jgi:hypothetical protein
MLAASELRSAQFLHDVAVKARPLKRHLAQEALGKILPEARALSR